MPSVFTRLMDGVIHIGLAMDKNDKSMLLLTWQIIVILTHIVMAVYGLYLSVTNQIDSFLFLFIIMSYMALEYRLEREND